MARLGGKVGAEDDGTCTPGWEAHAPLGCVVPGRHKIMFPTVFPFG